MNIENKNVSLNILEEGSKQIPMEHRNFKPVEMLSLESSKKQEAKEF